MRIVFGIIFLFSSLGLLVDSGSLLDNLVSCLVGLVITYFVFPKDIRVLLLEKIGLNKTRIEQLDKTKHDIEVAQEVKEQMENELDILKQKKTELTADINEVRHITIENELNRVDKLNGHEFEEYCGKLLTDLGYSNVNITVSSGDQGIDVLASMGTTSYGFQCKNYISVVGNKAVQEALAGKVFYKVDRVGVITNNYFTSSARSLAVEGNVELWDRDTLKELIEDSLEKRKTEHIPPKTERAVDEVWSDF